MDWTQCLTIIGANFSTAIWLFLIARKDWQQMEKNHREDMRCMENAHREDMRCMENAHLEDIKHHREDMQRHREDMQHMDAKWERLFGLFLELKSKY